jgi:hypothetical protein
MYCLVQSHRDGPAESRELAASGEEKVQAHRQPRNSVPGVASYVFEQDKKARCGKRIVSSANELSNLIEVIIRAQPVRQDLSLRQRIDTNFSGHDPHTLSQACCLDRSPRMRLGGGRVKTGAT